MYHDKTECRGMAKVGPSTSKWGTARAKTHITWYCRVCTITKSRYINPKKTSVNEGHFY
jgi:rubredoxin